jgi:hypothetical protein
MATIDESEARTEAPKHQVEIHLGRHGSDPTNQITIDGVDVTSGLHGITLLSAAAGAITTLHLEMYPGRIAAILDDPDIVRTMTEEECVTFLRSRGWSVIPRLER